MALVTRVGCARCARRCVVAACTAAALLCAAALTEWDGHADLSASRDRRGADGVGSRIDAGHEVGMLIAVLVEPDRGAGGVTMRWSGPTVTYWIDLPGYPAWFTAEVRAALAWVASQTSLQVVEMNTGAADITVVSGGASLGNGADATAQVDAGGEIVGVTVHLGCCRRRPVWEDIAQAFGPFGDRADGRSVFSQDHSRELPSCFDEAVLHTLYTLPAGTSPTAITPVARAVLNETCGDHLPAPCTPASRKC